MPVTNYLNLDIDKLFEEHTIKEIEQIQKKIEIESERKKIELRTLISERYRDLIQAADAITEMKETSEQVIERMAKLEETFHLLQQKYLIGFKIVPIETKSEREFQEKRDSVVMQLKILMDVPEKIWTAIDSKNILLATQLFILAQHLQYSLKLEVGDEELLNKYPIVTEQWKSISQFKTVIPKECNRILLSSDLLPESAANVLASLVILEKISAPALLEKLIVQRSRTIEEIVKGDCDHTVKFRVKSCIKLLNDTVTLIYTCFVTNDKNDGLISQHIKSMVHLEAHSMLLHLNLSSELLNKLLPTIATNHKPFFGIQFKDLSLSEIQESINTWLKWVRELIDIEMTKLLNLITSVRGIYNVREEVLTVHIPENWVSMWKGLSLPVLNFWAEFFKPLLTKRIKGIIVDKWNNALTNLKVAVSDLLSKVSREQHEFPEHDLRWYVWKDSPADIPQQLTKNSYADNKRSLLIKSKGFSPSLVKLCQDFDKSLLDLLLDLEQYLYETNKVMSAKNNLLTIDISVVSNKFADREELQEDLQNVSTSKIQDIKTFIREECIPEKPKFGRRETNAIVMARFLQALTSLCPNLNKCFALSKMSSLTMINVKWQSICDSLKEESIFTWTIWENLYKVKLCEQRDRHLKLSVDEFRIHLTISEWEKIMIEEEAEEGKRIKSEILVPYQPSVPLQKLLADVCRDLNLIIPHTIPKKILYKIIEDVVLIVFDYYQKMSECTGLRQKQAFQVLFDVKYVTLLMVARENKVLMEKSAEVCDKVLLKIDPFDLDVFYPFIHGNVKKSVQRSLLIYGTLVPHAEQLHSILGARSEYNVSDSTKPISNPPGVLALCTGAPWLPPLAVTAPARNLPLSSVSIPDKIQRKKALIKVPPKSDPTGTTIKSGAAAFFGAMGSDWFSTS
ncbi:conserved oligomeric Golgi complex subunit 1 isoform X2 [Orussus abietinus]|uniref:conserved oligomeric Golgi complex subunit 1 isoform X2 n=1 Tax=Orussus abietinus TaxID=222816 RepID=UPI000C715AF3|nr:conserved oligomeric Golgi complex subunit 1 isoform X2 [Orussus abietinus]